MDALSRVSAVGHEIQSNDAVHDHRLASTKYDRKREYKNVPIVCPNSIWGARWVCFRVGGVQYLRL